MDRYTFIDADDNQAGKFSFNSRSPLVRQRVRQMDRKIQLKALWRNKFTCTLKQAGSNKNETAHAMKYSLKPNIQYHTLSYWILFKNVWIFKVNFTNLLYLINHIYLFDENTKKAIYLMKELCETVCITIYVILFLLYYYI